MSNTEDDNCKNEIIKPEPTQPITTLLQQQQQQLKLCKLAAEGQPKGGGRGGGWLFPTVAARLIAIP